MLTKTKTFLILLLVVCATQFISRSAFADTNKYATLSLAGASYTTNADFSVSVYENSGSDYMSAVVLYLDYDQTKLQVVSIDPSAELNDFAPTSASGGQITVSRYWGSPPYRTSGQVKVATINFKGPNQPGSTDIRVNSQSVVAYAGKNVWDGVISSATFNFVNPSSTPITPPASTKPSAPSSGNSNPKSLSLQGTNILPQTLATQKYTISAYGAKQEPTNFVTNLLVSTGLAALAFIAMYFDAHNKIAAKSVVAGQQSAERIAHKKMIYGARRAVKGTIK